MTGSRSMRLATTLTVAAALLIGAVVVRTAQAQDFANEIRSLDIKHQIQDPLLAIMQAQFTSTDETMRYINKIGFEAGNDGALKTRTMAFQYNTVDVDGHPMVGKIDVPIICMVPIPYLRIEDVTIDFNMKLSSSFKTSRSATVESEVSFKFGIPFLFDVSGSASMKAQSNSSFQQSRSYSLRVYVHASAAPVPEGVLKVLDKLKESTKVTTRPGSSA